MGMIEKWHPYFLSYKISYHSVWVNTREKLFYLLLIQILFKQKSHLSRNLTFSIHVCSFSVHVHVAVFILVTLTESDCMSNM